MRFWPWNNLPKLRYDPGTHQVSVSLDRSFCLTERKAPQKLLKKAVAILEAHKTAGEIHSYITHTSRLTAVCNAMIAMGDEENSFSIDCVIAAGIPKMEGISIAAVKSEDTSKQLRTLLYLTIRAPRTLIAAWRVEWLEALIIEKLSAIGINDRPHLAQLESTLMRAAAGESTDQVPLMRAPEEAALESGAVHKSSFTISVNHTRKEMYAYINNPWFIRKAHADQQVLQALENAANKSEASRGTDYKVHRRQVSDALKAARTGIQGIGLELPLVILGGGTFTLGESTRPVNYPGQGRLFIEVSEDRMSAKIVRFNMGIYDDTTFVPDKGWLTRELERLGVAASVTAEKMGEALEKIRNKETLDGLEIAAGIPSTGGKEPYLFLTYQVSPLALSSGEDSRQVNMREIQQRSLVRTGQVIAEIKFKQPGADGKNVFGEALPKMADEPFEVKVGEGVDAVDGVFKARYDGAPGIDGNNITLAKAYIVNGDVDIRTGNIRFDGPVEIKGSIEANSIVECTGPLIVGGSIMGATVRCKTNISVQGSITMGGQGSVIAKDAIQAEFIENARLQCSGDIKANKAILNSEVISGKAVETIEGTGIIAGGSITSRESVRCGNLGFKNGATTEINCGGDFKAELGARIRKNRLTRLQNLQEEVKNTLKELNSKSASQMTPRLEEMKKVALRKQGMLKGLIEKAQAHLRAAQAKISYQEKSKVYIQNLLTTNCRVMIGGKVIPIETDMIGCVIQGKQRKGSYIVAINEADAGEGASGDTGEASPKAS
ncbi:MAG: hypothetical protein RIQ81_374 [Pseudomonadota bacterium]